MNHVHAPDPEEIISMEFQSIVNTGATMLDDLPRRIIHEDLLYIKKMMELLYQIVYLRNAHLKVKENNKINHYQHLLHLMIFLFLMNLK